MLFLAHDPGGYDVIQPLVRQTESLSLPYEFIACGPSAVIQGTDPLSEDRIIARINKGLKLSEFSGLVAGTSWGSQLELTIIRRFKEWNIPTIAVLDYWSNYFSRFKCSEGDVVLPDYYVVMDDIAYKEAVLAGIPGDIIRVLGHPGLDKYVSKGKQIKAKVNGSLKVLFLSQPLSELYNQELGFTEFNAFEDCTELLADEVKFTLHLKCHPKETVSFKNKYKSWIVEGHLQDILADYDLVVGMNTMGLLHASLMGLPTVSYQPGLIQMDSAITNKLGLSLAFYSKHTFKHFISENIFDYVNGANDRNLSRLLWMDGKSTDRVIKFIREVVHL